MITTRRIFLSVILALINVVAAGCGNDDQRADSENPLVHALVEGIVAEYGGEEAMVRVKSYHAEGTIFAFRWKVNAPMARWFKRPDCLLLKLAYPDRAEWRLTRGDQGWTGPSMGDWKVAGMPKIWAMRLQTIRFDLPLLLRERESELVLMQADEKGRPVLRLTIDEGLHMEYHVDPASHRILTTMMVMEGPPTMYFQADYADFRMVDGVLFPHTEETWARGTRTSFIRINSIEINPDGLADLVAEPETTTMDGML